MAEKLLRLHMTSENQSQKAKVISEALNTKFFHHGYPVSKTEAKEIGLPIAAQDLEVESVMWEIWKDLETDLQFRQPFSPVRVLHEDPACAPLFNPAQAPGAAIAAPPAKFLRVSAVMESHRHASRHLVEGNVSGIRMPDQKLNISVMQVREGWEDVAVQQVATDNQTRRGVSKGRRRRAPKIQ
jgi:hypothetical protein